MPKLQKSVGDIVEFTGGLVRLFGNGQGDNGWFSGIFYDEASGTDVRISGVCHELLDVDATYEVKAVREFSKQYGESFKIQTMRQVVALNEYSIKRFLQSALFPGVGEKTATKIVDTYGTSSLDVIMNGATKMQKHLSLSDKVMDVLVTGVVNNQGEVALRRVAPGFSDNVLTRMLNYYCERNSGEEVETHNLSVNQLIDKLKSDPYSVLVDIPRLRFADVDEGVLSMGWHRYQKRRVDACVNHATHLCTEQLSGSHLRLDNNDHYYLLWQTLAKLLDTNPDYEGEPVDGNACIQACNQALSTLDKHQGLVFVTYQNGVYIYPSRKYMVEQRLASRFKDILSNESRFVERTNMSEQQVETYIDRYEQSVNQKLDKEQRKAVIRSLFSPASIISGGPGRGKTSTVACILFIWKTLIGSEPILSAPTGKAVMVLRNAIKGEYDVSTIMRRICQMTYPTPRRERAYTDALVVVDETSMVGMRNMAEFLAIFKGNCQFIFLGDVDQLASIDYGQCFKDMCESEAIPLTYLKTNHRSSGLTIDKNAQLINQGLFDKLDYTHPEEYAVYHSYNDNPQQLVRLYLEAVQDVKLSHRGFIADKLKMPRVGLIAAMTSGVCGTRNLNYLIQKQVNPHGQEVPGSYYYVNNSVNTRLRVGDRVRQTRNNYDVDCVDKNGEIDKGIYNGDTGFIVSLTRLSKDNRYTVSVNIVFDDGRSCKLTGAELEDVELAYAITGHKSQGSEYDVVLVSMQNSLASDYLPAGFACRNLIYTIVTRAKKRVVIVGNNEAVARCAITPSPERPTLLGPLLATN